MGLLSSLLVNHHIVEGHCEDVTLRLENLEDHLVQGVGPIQVVNVHALLLANPVCSVLRLDDGRMRPGKLSEHDALGRS